MNIEYLGKKPIAILGAGGVGKPCAADSKLAGREVRLWDDPKFAVKSLANVEKAGLFMTGPETNLLNFKRNGHVFLDMVSDDLAKVVKGSGLVVVTTVALGHKPLFEKLIPLLEDGQFVYIMPDNYGVLLLRKMMKEANCTTKVIVGSWGTSPYGARVVVKGGVTTNEINIIDRVCIQRGAAMPTSDMDIFMESAKYFPPFDPVYFADGIAGMGFQRADTVLDNAISNINPVIHVPGAVLGAAVMQNFELLGNKMQNYSLYAHALCPAIAEVQVDFWKESEAVAKACGTIVSDIDTDDFFARSTIYGPEYMGKGYKVPFSEDYRYKQEPYGDGPFSLDNRYITEDIPIGCYMVSLLGKKFGVETPVTDSMILLGGIMSRKDLIGDCGYDLEYLGIEHMNKEELNAWLRDCVYTDK